MDPITILTVGAILVAMYFLMFRPAQARAKEQLKVTSSMEPGVRVMTSAGVFGTLRHVGSTQVILEISPGVEMTVLKQAIIRVVSDAEEEFEYDADSDDEPEEVAALDDSTSEPGQVAEASEDEVAQEATTVSPPADTEQR